MLKGHYYYLLLSQLSCYNQILIGQIGYYQQKFIPYSAGGWKCKLRVSVGLAPPKILSPASGGLLVITGL